MEISIKDYFTNQFKRISFWCVLLVTIITSTIILTNRLENVIAKDLTVFTGVVIISLLIINQALKLRTTLKLKWFANLIILSYAALILITAFYTLIMISSNLVLPHKLFIWTNIYIPLQLILVIVDFLQTYFLLRAGHKRARKLWFSAPMIFLCLVFLAVVIISLIYFKANYTYNLFVIYTVLLSLSFLYLIYSLSCANSKAVTIFLIGRLLPYSYDYIVSTLPVTHHVYGYAPLYLLEIFGIAISYVGLSMICNNKTLKPNKYFYNQTSLSVQFPLWGTLTSLLLGIMLTLLPTLLSIGSLNVVTIDPNSKIIMPSACAIYIILVVLLYKSITIYTLRPINNMINMISRFRLKGSFERDAANKNNVKEYKFLESYVNRSFKQIIHESNQIKLIHDSALMFSHDVQSPLKTLSLIVDKSIDDKEKSEIVIKAIESIEASTRSLLR